MSHCDLGEIGNRISTRRKQLGFTQEQLANMMDVSVQMISNLERGVKAIRIENLIKLSEILKVSTDYILTGKDNIQDVQSLTEQILGLMPSDKRLIELIINHLSDSR